MEVIKEISWDELKGQYYHNLENLQNSIDTAHTSSMELYRIYAQVMKKSKDTSPEMIKKFTDSWLQNLDMASIESSEKLKKKFKGLLQNPQPSERDLNEFEQLLQEELKYKSLIMLSGYQNAMHGFYKIWMKMWGK